MTKHFDRIPLKEPPREAGIPSYEHCLNHIGTNDEFWDVIDGLLEPKELNDKTTIKRFKSNLLHYLAEFVYETPVKLPKNQDERQDKSIEITKLSSLKNDIEKTINKYDLIGGPVFSYFFDKAESLSDDVISDEDIDEAVDDFMPVDVIAKNREYTSRARSACRITRRSLDILYDITCKQIDAISEREKPIRPEDVNASLKYDLATYLCHAVSDIGFKPSGAPESFLDGLYKVCWVMLSPDKKEPGLRDRPLQYAVRDFKKNEKAT
jgi:hypothetical protein